MPKRSTEKEAYWWDVLRRRRTSGLSVRQFCVGERLSMASYYRWKREIAARDRKTGKSARERGGKRPQRSKQAADPASLFLPVRLNAAVSSTIEARAVAARLARRLTTATL